VRINIILEKNTFGLLISIMIDTSDIMINIYYS
jgi:hypothetical protein